MLVTIVIVSRAVNHFRVVAAVSDRARLDEGGAGASITHGRPQSVVLATALAKCNWKWVVLRTLPHC